MITKNCVLRALPRNYFYELLLKRECQVFASKDENTQKLARQFFLFMCPMDELMDGLRGEEAYVALSQPEFI